MAPLTDNLRRWVRLQRELGLDEVFLDEPWAPPAAAPSAPNTRGEPPRRAPAPAAPAAPTRLERPAAPPPVRAERAPTAAPAARQDFTFKPPVATPPPARPPIQAPAPRPGPVRAATVPTFSDMGALHGHMRSCTRCILSGKRKAVIVEGGAKASSWAVLTLYGWADDDATGQLLSGTYAASFRDLVRASGLPEPVVLPLLACTPQDPADMTIQGFTEAVRCRPHWTQALKLLGAKAVLVLDHKATQFARGPSAPVSWPAFRGEPWSLEGLPAISTHHPARLARSAQLAPEVASDLAHLKTLLENAP